MAQSFHIEKLKLDKYNIMILSKDSMRIHEPSLFVKFICCT